MPRINSEYREGAKKKIVTAALDVASSGGWDAVTLEAIAQKVGVTKGALYSYYANSDTLMQDVIIEMIRTIRDQVLAVLSEESEIHAALDAVAGFIYLQKKPFVMVFTQAMTTLPDEPSFREKISGIYDENRAVIISTLSCYQEEGQIPKEVDLSSAVEAIYAMTLGLGVLTHVLGKDEQVMKMAWVEAAERILMIDRVWEGK